MSAPVTGFRSRDLVASLSEAMRAKEHSFWCANDVYAGGCVGAYEGGSYPACFSSNAGNIRYDPAGWAAFYERIYTLREREMDAVMAGYEATLGACPLASSSTATRRAPW